MTIEQCYRQLHGDYAQMIQRLPSAALIERFVGKFLEDDSYPNLCSALKAGDADAAFRAAHTLKGVSANLSFEQLHASSSQLTELLRGTSSIPAGTQALAEQVSRDYEMTINAIRTFQSQRG